MTTPMRSFVVSLMLVVAATVNAETPLSKRAYEKVADTHGIVILHVNWGRYRGCGPYENAQLQRLIFKLLDKPAAVSEKEALLDLASGSRLMARPEFSPFAYVVTPGTYGLVGGKLKVAASVTDIRVAELGSGGAMAEEQAHGGTFTVAPGEIVYIGHFGIDCFGEPTLWRFYIEDPNEWPSYVAGFHTKFRFLEGKPVVYRLFQTDRFGKSYELPR